MKVIYFTLVVLFNLFNLCNCLSLDIFRKPKCSADQTCIKYEDCNEIKGKSFSNQITRLEIINLRCGFQDDKYLLICCKNDIVPSDNTDESNDSVEENTTDIDDYEYTEEEKECKKNAVPSKQYPWLALLSYKNERFSTYSVMCNGALINKNYILTTADCINVPNYKLEYVKLGVDNANDYIYAADRKIESTKIHPNHQDIRSNIALIKLIDPIIYSDLMIPICLTNETINDNEINLIGFNFERYIPKNNLKNVEIFKSKQTVSTTNKSNIYSNNKINSIAASRNSCMVSNGGSLVAEDTNVIFLIGLKINAFQQCSATLNIGNTYNNTFTNIADNYAWIVNNSI